MNLIDLDSFLGGYSPVILLGLALLALIVGSILKSLARVVLVIVGIVLVLGMFGVTALDEGFLTWAQARISEIVAFLDSLLGKRLPKM